MTETEMPQFLQPFPGRLEDLVRKCAGSAARSAMPDVATWGARELPARGRRDRNTVGAAGFEAP